MADSFESMERSRYFKHVPSLLAFIFAVGFIIFIIWQTAAVHRIWPPKHRPIPNLRPLVFNLTDFGAIGDGKTLNTNAFEKAISEIERRGGGQLNVEAGHWLTAPFNLTSHMTLFLAQNAVILGIDDEKYWPIMPHFPYGYGKEHAGPRYGSLIHGQNLMDVVITGHNGTINGQGRTWWTKYREHLLNYTRGPLIQLMWSRDVHISDVTLRDSPFWTLHPYECQNVTIQNVTLLAPPGSPNTDGISPDSCENMVIEDSYISVGDDVTAIKIGWDRYGTADARPSTNIIVRNVIVHSMISAGVSIGGEMSGGVSNVKVENILVWNSRTDEDEERECKRISRKALPLQNNQMIQRNRSFVGNVFRRLSLSKKKKRAKGNMFGKL